MGIKIIYLVFFVCLFVFGEIEKNSFIALPGRGPQQANNALRTVCTNLEGVMRSF